MTQAMAIRYRMLQGFLVKAVGRDVGLRLVSPRPDHLDRSGSPRDTGIRLSGNRRSLRRVLDSAPWGRGRGSHLGHSNVRLATAVRLASDGRISPATSLFVDATQRDRPRGDRA